MKAIQDLDKKTIALEKSDKVQSENLDSKFKQLNEIIETNQET